MNSPAYWIALAFAALTFAIVSLWAFNVFLHRRIDGIASFHDGDGPRSGPGLRGPGDGEGT